MQITAGAHHAVDWQARIHQAEHRGRRHARSEQALAQRVTGKVLRRTQENGAAGVAPIDDLHLL